MNTTDLTPTHAPVLSLSPAALPSDRNPVLVYLGRLAPGSRRAMRGSLQEIACLITGGTMNAELLPWWELRYQHTQAIRTALAEKYAATTANKMLAALRGVLQESWRLQYMTAEEYHRAVDLKSIRGTSLLRGRALGAGEIRSLFAVCAEDPTPAGSRDAALFALLYAGGLRRSEIVALDLADYDRENSALTIKKGKGKKDRQVYVSNGAQEALESWLQVRGNEPGPVFFPINKGGNIIHSPKGMNSQGILEMVYKRANQAQLPHFSPHDLRRSMISDLLDAGADLSAVQALVGHANIQTTARYDRRGERAKQKAAGMLTVPFVKSSQKRPVDS